MAKLVTYIVNIYFSVIKINILTISDVKYIKTLLLVILIRNVSSKQSPKAGTIKRMK